MSAENLTKNMTEVPNVTNVTLVSGDDKVSSNKDVIFACIISDKSYDKKSSFQSHMRTKHRTNKNSDLEKGPKQHRVIKAMILVKQMEN